MQKAITVSVYGGLGNQMFQYALGTTLAQRNAAQLVLDLGWFECRKAPSVTPWKFALHNFPRTEFITSSRGADLFEDRRTLKSVAAKVNAKLGRFICGDRLYVERHFHYDPGVLSARAGAWLVGYWQSPKYFESAAETLKHQFGRTNLSEDSERICENIAITNSVCLHVRRGDYLGTSTHGVCDADYYRQAIQLLSRELEDPHFFIFSDDPEWARMNVRVTGRGSTVVDVNGPEQAHEDLMLMSTCKHFIIANSTFSWWAAWLSTHEKKRVVSPMRWFATPDFDTRDLLPSDWRRL
jgi:hypothetical protein